MGREVWQVAVVHPAAILRGQWEYDPVQPEVLERVRHLVAGSWAPPPIDQPSPGALHFPTMDELHTWADAIQGEGVSCDIESAGDRIRCIGFARLRDLAYACVHFRTQGGDLYDPAVLPERAAFCYDLFASPERGPLVLHNGISFDVPVLERVGFRVVPPVEDTIVQAHVAYVEQPKSLQWLSIVHLGSTAWKLLVRDDEEGEGK